MITIIVSTLNGPGKEREFLFVLPDVPEFFRDEEKKEKAGKKTKQC